MCNDGSCCPIIWFMPSAGASVCMYGSCCAMIIWFMRTPGAPLIIWFHHALALQTARV
jgi:hypothetical protein